MHANGPGGTTPRQTSRLAARDGARGEGLLSRASLVMGVAAAHGGRSNVLIAGLAALVAGAMSMAAGEYVSVHSQKGRVGDWRAGLGRSSCSLLARSFVCECHTISTLPRFQPPPR